MAFNTHCLGLPCSAPPPPNYALPSCILFQFLHFLSPSQSGYAGAVIESEWPRDVAGSALGASQSL